MADMEKVCGEDANKGLVAFLIFILIIGAWVFLRFLFRQLGACVFLCCRGKRNLLSVYAKSSNGQAYAVVTGGSDGLGLEMCDQLAAQGFNIAMVSRNQEKIDRKIEELKKVHPNVQFKGVQADLSKMNTLDEYKEFVQRELACLDIAVLCLNAGCMPTGPTDMMSDADFERVFAMNNLHVVYLTKAILPQQLNRGDRSTILFVSSCLANIPMPGIGAYCASKAMVSNFAEGLYYEVRHKIDVTCRE